MEDDVSCTPEGVMIPTSNRDLDFDKFRIPVQCPDKADHMESGLKET